MKTHVAAIDKQAPPVSLRCAEELAELSISICEGKGAARHYRLENDIDLSGYRENGGWNPIGSLTNPFRGIFDGCGHTISGLYIDRPTEAYQGLFGSIHGIVRDLNVSDCDIRGADYSGSVAGFSDCSRVENIHVSGRVTGRNFVGGIAGEFDSGNLDTLWMSGSVQGLNHVGGAVGTLWKSTIRCCCNSGSVTGEDYVGGMAGYISYGWLMDCRNECTVNGDDYVGGLSGCTDGGIIYGCTTDCTINGMLAVGGAVGISHNHSVVDKCRLVSRVTGKKYADGLIGQQYG